MRRDVYGRRQPRARRRAWAASLVAAALALGTGAFFAPADALTAEWVLGYTDGTFAQPGDVISSTNLDLSITGIYMGNPITVDCVNVSTTGFRYTVPSPVPSGPTNGTIQVQLDTPPATLTGCTLSWDGSPVNVSFVAGSKWTLDIDLPTYNGSATGQAHMTPVLTGRITVPTGDPSGYGNGTVVLSATTLGGDGGLPPCTIQGPAHFDLSVNGSYDPSIGIVSNTNTPAFLLDNGAWPPGFPPLSGTPASQANCSAVGVQPTLDALSLTLEGPGGKIPTLVWSP